MRTCLAAVKPAGCYQGFRHAASLTAGITGMIASGSKRALGWKPQPLPVLVWNDGGFTS